MMTTTQQDKPGGKPRQRSRKAEQRSRKSDQPNGPAPDRRDEDQIRPMVASSDAPEVETAAAAEVPLVGEVLPPVTTATSAAEPVPVDVISLQTIANAYADYARTSLQESRSFAEKLMGVRSFDKAIELQSEFARQAFANFVAESQKICGLYTRWARQSFRPWEVTAAKLTQAGRQSW
jgi:hypothetical protein